jgi:predicted nuclease of predicted toxin-antitoxin system
MKFFFDNNLSPNLVRGLKSFGEDVIHLTDIFPPDEPDIKWLKHIGENGLTLITRDEAIRWHPAETEAFREYQVGAFFLGGKKEVHGI